MKNIRDSEIHALMHIARAAALFIAIAACGVFCLSGVVLAADAGDKGENVLVISYGYYPNDGKSWRYVMEREGVLREIGEAEAKRIEEKALPEPGEGPLIMDYVIPGNVTFLFAGEAPGEVDLRFYYNEGQLAGPPDITCTVRVYDDLTSKVVKEVEHK